MPIVPLSGCCEQSLPYGQRPTLGQTLRQGRTAQHRSLLDVATHVYKADGTQISPQYLHALERDRRTPSPYVLAELARALRLDLDLLLGLAHRGEATVQTYFKDYPTQETEVIAFFRTARLLHFHDWTWLRQQLCHYEA